MARKNYTGYPGKGLWENDNFRNGMVYTDEALRRGMAKALVNMDISKTGGTLEVRDPFYSSAFKLPGHDLPKGLGKNTLMFKSVQETGYEFFIDFENYNGQSTYKTINSRSIVLKDGDSFVDKSTGKEYRLLGIDTPEHGKEGYDDAKAYLQSLVDTSERVFLIYDVLADSKTDIYGRDLVFVLGRSKEWVEKEILIYDINDQNFEEQGPTANVIYLEEDTGRAYGSGSGSILNYPTELNNLINNIKNTLYSNYELIDKTSYAFAVLSVQVNYTDTTHYLNFVLDDVFTNEMYINYNTQIFGSVSELENNLPALTNNLGIVENYDLEYLGTGPMASDMEVTCSGGKMNVMRVLPYQQKQWYRDKQLGVIRQDTGEGYDYWQIVLNNGVDNLRHYVSTISESYINYNIEVLKNTEGTTLAGVNIDTLSVAVPEYKGVVDSVLSYDFKQAVQSIIALGKNINNGKELQWVTIPKKFDIHRKPIRTNLESYEELGKIKLPVIDLENVSDRLDLSQVYEDLNVSAGISLAFKTKVQIYKKDTYETPYLPVASLQDIDGLAIIGEIYNTHNNLKIYEGLITIKYYIPVKDNEILYNDYSFKVETYKTKAFKVKYEDINTKYSLNLLDKELPKRQDFIGEVATENGYYSYEIPYIDILNKDNKPVLQAAENRDYTIRPYFVLPELDAIKDYDGYALKWEFYRQNDKYANYILFSVSEEADLPSEGSENTLYVIYNPTKVYKVWTGSAYSTVTPLAPTKVFDWTPVFDSKGELLKDYKVETVIKNTETPEVFQALIPVDYVYNTSEEKTNVALTSSPVTDPTTGDYTSIYSWLTFFHYKTAFSSAFTWEEFNVKIKNSDPELVFRFKELVEQYGLMQNWNTNPVENYNTIKVCLFKTTFESLKGYELNVDPGQVSVSYSITVSGNAEISSEGFTHPEDFLEATEEELKTLLDRWIENNTYDLRTQLEFYYSQFNGGAEHVRLSTSINTANAFNLYIKFEGYGTSHYRILQLRNFQFSSNKTNYSLLLDVAEALNYAVIPIEDVVAYIPDNYHLGTTLPLSELDNLIQETRGDLYFKVHVAPYRINETTKDLETGFEMELNSRYLAKTLFVRSKEELEPYYTHGQDLSKCRSITAYKGQLVLYGNPNNPTTLYFSDEGGNVSYFPLKKALDQFYSPIIHVEPVQQGLVVFTTNDIYLVYEAMNEKVDDFGNVTTEYFMVAGIIYSNLSIKPHNRNTVRSSGQDIIFMAEDSMLMLRPNPYVNDIKDVFLEDISAGIKDILENPKEFIETRLKYYNETDDVVLDNYTIEPYLIIKNKEYWLHFSVDIPGQEPLMFILVYNREQKPFYWKIYDTRACSFPYQHLMFDPLEGFHVLTRNHKTYDNGTTLMLNEALNLMDFAEDYGTVFDIQTMRPVEGVFQYWSVTLPTIEEYRTDEMYQKVKQPIRGLIDTGYMDISTHLKKRFHKFYMELFNIDAFKIPLFLDFNIDGMERQTSTKMELVQDGEGVLYYEKTLQVIDSAKMDLWELDTSIIERVKKFRINVGISGRGRNPQILLGFKTTGKFRLYKYGIIFKEQDAR